MTTVLWIVEGCLLALATGGVTYLILRAALGSER